MGPTIIELPQEILHIIFGFCNVSDLIQSVQYVCQLWNELVSMSPVWNHKILRITESEVNAYYLGRAPFLNNIYVENATNSETLLLMGDYCPLLKKLQLNCKDYFAIPAITSKLPCLTHIDICFHKTYKLEVAIDNSVLSLPHVLRTVIFRKCTTDCSLPLSLFQNCSHLEHLVVSLNPELEDYVEKSVSISSCNTKSMPGSHNMYTVYLCCSMVANKDILNAVSQFPNLKCLALKLSLFNDKEMLESVFSHTCPELKFLDLSYSFNLNTEVVLSIAKMCPNLVSLSLKRCYIGDEAFSAVIDNLSRLQHLNLHGTLITSLHFHCIPEKLPRLTDINLCACRQVNRKALTDLVNAMPDLLIVHPRSGFVTGLNAVGRQSPFTEKRNAIEWT